ncbi:MAG: hypoxanthine phosphoribosyltransferase [Phycisphaerae bacterium]|jgi:hypoxanthine phosphoribosyltransferase|nr:hypoxanthine phosphoribosyltransferase [Phycisphaerae bacterium]
MKDEGPPHANPIEKHLARLLVPRDRIADRTVQLAQEIASFYEGRDVTLLAVLTGALIFVADLMRLLPLAARVEPVVVSSYPGRATRGQVPQFRLPPAHSLAGRHVLIVDDIYDSGRTMQFLTETAADAGAETVRSCVLLRKDRPDIASRPAEPHFVGFDIPDEFVVGYGLDFDDLYRNLPDIGVLRQHATGDGDDA